MRKRMLIVGGGTAGWMSAAYLARTLSADRPGGIEITLIESEDISIVGVGEGTFPSIRKTLKRIALDESVLIREAEATFKQGILFRNWKSGSDASSTDSYFHPFQISGQHTDIDLLPYWLLGVAEDAPWAGVNTVQKAIVEAKRAPGEIRPDLGESRMVLCHVSRNRRNNGPLILNPRGDEARSDCPRTSARVRCFDSASWSAP